MTKQTNAGHFEHDRLPRPLAEDRAAEIRKLRSLTMEQRGALIAIACRTAAKVECSRRENGLPPSVSVPWPASTWEILKRSSQDA